MPMMAVALLMLSVACGTADKKTSDGHHDQHGMAGADTMHVQHISLADNFVHSELIVLPDAIDPGPSVRNSLSEMVKAYLEIGNALTKDDLKAADAAIAEMLEKVKATDALSITIDEKGAWNQHAALYSAKLQEMLHVQNLEAKRSYFGHISEAMYCTVKSFEFDHTPLYANHCPMAFDNKGAYWLSAATEIENPYFGSKMLKCGKREEEL